MQGFTGRPSLRELAALARKRRVPLIEDLGSGALVDVAQFGLEPEPTITESLQAGCTLVTCSGDKLLGGSQAGLILGRKAWVSRVKRDPFARALRLDKLALAALEATLALYADPSQAAKQVPVLGMLSASPSALRRRAGKLEAALRKHVPGATVKSVVGSGEVGGGSLPLQKLPGPVVELSVKGRTAQEIDRAARSAVPPVIGTIRRDRFRLDPRTMTAAETEEAARVLAAALAQKG
jgi:L-seryl-tRNA(Ser) seleniumtransferase